MGSPTIAGDTKTPRPARENAPEISPSEALSKPNNQHEVSHEAKALSTLKARLALSGWACFELSDGTFVVSQWGQCRPLRDLHALTSFARQIGGATC